MSRYLERAETSARLLNVFSQLRMDLPKGTELPWVVLPDIFGSTDGLKERKDGLTESVVVEFLIARVGNASSLRSSIASARENARTTRHLLPKEFWELVNELHLYVCEFGEKSIARRNRFEFLIEVTNRCQTLNGLVMTTQPRDEVYTFMSLGHLLERLDLTCRVISTMSPAIESRMRSNPGVDSLIWASLLESLSSLNTYRHLVGPMVEPQRALNLIALHPESPRSTVFCLTAIRQLLARFRKKDYMTSNLDRVLDELSSFDAGKLTPAEISKRFRELQLFTCEIYSHLSEIWHVPEKL